MTLHNVLPAHRLRSGFYPDPTVCQMPDGRLLMVNSSFEYFPGLPISVSDDGYKWKHVGYAMCRRTQFPYNFMDNNQGIYAPTIRYFNGIYYLIVTNVNVGNMIVTSTDPLGEDGGMENAWSDPIWVKDWPGIDPSFFMDDDGQVYICGNESSQPDTHGNYEKPGIYIARIDLRTGDILSGRHHICAGTGSTNPEGPHIYKRDGMYYLMWAEGGTEQGHMENIARSSDVYGPYEMCPTNPLLTNRSTHLSLQSIGHCDCAGFERDRTYMVFHGVRMTDDYPAQGWLGRESYGVWFEWKDGWPDLSSQSYDCVLDERYSIGDDFDLSSAWMTTGRDDDGQYVIADDGRTVTVRVNASGHGFDMRSGGIVAGIRQPAMRCSFSARLHDMRELTDGVEAGLCVYANKDHYMTLSLSKSHESYLATSRVYNAGIVSIIALLRIDTDSMNGCILRINCDERGYSFSIEHAGHKRDLGHAPGKILSFTNAGGFTGTLLGVYAHDHVSADNPCDVTFSDIACSDGLLSEI